jgi:hypothetical protein
VTGEPRWALSLLPAEPDQVLRRSQYRRDHPGVTIRAGLGFWQAQIPQHNGEMIITRYQLRELLDKLDALTGQPDSS